MATSENDTLIKLSDSEQTVSMGDDDIRGRHVKDRAGEDIGKIGDLLIDKGENKVRFLLVESGGFLGIGKDKLFIPVDAITGISDDEVRVDQTREHLAGAPDYDPDLVDERPYYDEVYGYYGYTPYWGAGYAYPAYPYYGGVV